MSSTPPSVREEKPVIDATIVANTRVNSKRHLWLAILLCLAGLTGLYQLEQLLNAIPDSNDDFIYF